jgi:pimeloyl-ACP methyl ester carboxylesterase
MYKEIRLSRSEYVPIRGIDYHVLRWGQTRSRLPPLLLLHGWMDVAASYQFVVDALDEAFVQGRSIIAPDWRGYGQTGSGGTDNFWFPDYLADLDFLLDHYAPGQQIDLVGHSMGGNVAMLYAGVRPERIRKLVNLEGFGMAATEPDQAPARYAQWMDDASGVARRLMRTNPRLSQDKADWLARHWARPDAQGQWNILGDAAHKVVNAQLYRVDEVLAIYQRISAPTLAVEASDDSLEKRHKGQYTLADFHERLKSVPQVSSAVIQDAGHMLHHDQPEQLARLLAGFLD